MTQLNAASADIASNTKKGSAFGNEIIESQDVEFSKNPFNKYTAEDFDRFNTLLSGKNGAEAQESTDKATRNVNNLYNEFKSKYPNAKITLPEPPNPADYDKGTKGYHAYEKALLQWEADCKIIIDNETKLQEAKQSDIEPEKPLPSEPEPVPIEDETKPVKEKHPKKKQSKVGDGNGLMEKMPSTPPPEDTVDLDFGEIIRKANEKLNKNGGKYNLVPEGPEILNPSEPTKEPEVDFMNDPGFYWNSEDPFKKKN